MGDYSLFVWFNFWANEKFMNSGRKHKYSGEELAVAISQLLGALPESKYLADTWNFVLEARTSADDYIRDPDYPAEAYF